MVLITLVLQAKILWQLDIASYVLKLNVSYPFKGN